VPFTSNWRVTRYYAHGVLNGTATQTGRTYVITVPGAGVIFQQTARGIQEKGQTVSKPGRTTSTMPTSNRRLSGRLTRARTAAELSLRPTTIVRDLTV
jgi:hypothetical protein